MEKDDPQSTTRTVYNPLTLVARKLDKVADEISEETQALATDAVGEVDSTLKEEAPIVSQAFNSSRDLVTKIMEKEQEDVDPPSPHDEKLGEDTEKIVNNTKDGADGTIEAVESLAISTDKMADEMTEGLEENTEVLEQILEAQKGLTDTIVDGQNRDDLADLEAGQDVGTDTNADIAKDFDEDSDRSWFDELKDKFVITASGLLSGLASIFQWGTIKTFISKMWTKLITRFSGVFTWIGKRLSGIGKFLLRRVIAIPLAIIGAINAVKKGFDEWMENGWSMDVLWEAIGGFIEGFTLGLIDDEKVADILKEAWDTIKTFFNETLVPMAVEMFAQISELMGEIYDKYIKPEIDASILKMQGFFKEFLGEDLYNFFADMIRWFTIGFTAAIDDFNKHIGPVMDNIKIIAGNVMDAITGVFTWLHGVWVSLIEDLEATVKFFMWVGPQLIIFKDKFMDFIHSLGEITLTDITAFIKDIPYKLLALFETGLAAVFGEDTAETVSGILTNILDAVMWLPNMLLDTITSLFSEDGRKSLMMSFVDIWDTIVGIPESIMKFLVDIFDMEKAKTLMTESLNNILGFYTGIFDKVFAVVGDLWDSIFGEGSFDKVKTKVVDKVMGAVNNLVSVITSIFDVFGDIYDAFKSGGISGAFSAIKSMFTDVEKIPEVVEKGEKAVEKEKEEGGGLWDSIKGYLSDEDEYSDVEKIKELKIASNDSSFEPIQSKGPMKLEPVKSQELYPAIERGIEAANDNGGGDTTQVNNTSSSVVTNNNTTQLAPLSADNRSNEIFVQNSVLMRNMGY